MGVGLLSYGAYLPRLRLQRDAVASFNAWFTGSSRGKGERTMANWDEDSVTMAVEAARNCLAGIGQTPSSIQFVSTSPAFDDRQNAAIMASALDLEGAVETMDVTSSLRGGTAAMIAGLRAAGGDGGPVLVTAADHRRTRSAAAQEQLYGDGAASMLIGAGEPIAEFVGSYSVSADLVDHFRGRGAATDYGWEERWARDEGWLKLVPQAIQGALEAAGLKSTDIDYACIPGTMPKLEAQIAKRAGLPEAAVRDTLGAVCGDTGSAHPLLMLAQVLEEAKPGQHILVVGFGQGCDAMIFKVTPAIEALPRRASTSAALARRKPESSIGRFLAFNKGIDLERGMRAELDKQTALSSHYRNRELVQGLVGGVCRECGTRQFPRSHICVNPNCRKWHSQDRHRFADTTARVMSFTADMLIYSPDPPSHCGMVEFEGGGRFMADFTDVDTGNVDVGMPMRMMFRIKDHDPQRNFTRYFWKAAPAGLEAN